MAFDLGFNFRASAVFVTDQSYAVPVLGEEYPHTYTNADGYSSNAGWVSFAGCGTVNRASGNDPRIAGANYGPGIGLRTFTVALDSGSAPGAGDYTVDLALGDTDPDTQSLLVRDDTTTVIDVSNGGAGFAIAGGHYRDATATDVTASTTWTGATASVTFASTTVNVDINIPAILAISRLAHFRLTLQGGAAEEEIVPQLALLGVGR